MELAELKAKQLDLLRQRAAMLEDEKTRLTVQVDSDNAKEDLAQWSKTTEYAQPNIMDMYGLPGMARPTQGANKTIKGRGEGKDKAETISRALQIDPKTLDTTTGLPAWDRAIMDLLPTDANQEAWLRGEFDNNVKLLNIDGDIKKYYLDPKTKNWTQVDEEGFGAGDIFDFTGEATVATAAIMAAPTGGTSLLGMAAAATAAGTAWGVGQDVAARALMLEDGNIDPLEIVERRGREAAISFGSDLIIPGIGRTLTRAAAPVKRGSQVVNKQTGEMLDATKRLEAKYDQEIDKLIVDLDKAGRVAEDIPSGMLANKMMGIKNSAFGIMNGIRGNVNEAREAMLAGARNYELRMKKKVETMKTRFNDRQLDVVTYMQNKYKRSLNEAAGPAQVSPAVEGGKMQNWILGNLKSLKAAASDLYKPAYDALEAAGHGVSIRDVFNVARKAKQGAMARGKHIDPKDQALPRNQNAIANQIGQAMGDGTIKNMDDLLASPLLAGEMSYRKLDDIIRQLRKSVDYQPGVAKNPDEALIKEMVGRLVKLRDVSMDKLGLVPKSMFKTYKSEYDKASNFWQENVKPFKSKVLADIYGETANEFSTTGVAAMNRALGSVEAVNSVLKAAGTNSNEVRQILLRRFWDKKGIYAGSTKYSKFDLSVEEADILKALGEDPAKIASIKSLSRMSQDGFVTMDNVRRLASEDLKTPAERIAFKEALKKSSKAEAKVHEKVADTLFGTKQTLAGLAKIDDPDLYISEMLSKRASPKTIKALMDGKTDLEKQATAQAVFDWIISGAKKGGGSMQKTSKALGGDDIFNPDAMRSLLKTHDTKLKILLGDKHQDLKDIFTLVEGARTKVVPPKTSSATIGSTPRVGEQAQPGFFVRWFAHPVGHVKSKILSAMYGSGLLQRFVRGDIVGIDPSAADPFPLLYKKLLATPEGLHALAIEAERSQELMDFILGDLSKFNEESGSYNPMLRDLRKPIQ